MARPTIQRLTIRNYRLLRDVTFDKLTPLTVLFGPNGSGKSTVFDVFAFLHEAFTTNLRRAWDTRNRMPEIRSRGAVGVLGERVPNLERVESEQMPDGRLLLRLRDRPFETPVLAQYISDGTLKLLAYLTVLYDPDPAPIVGVENARAADIPQLAAMAEAGGLLGDLWMEGHFGLGDPLVRSGRPR